MPNISSTFLQEKEGDLADSGQNLHPADMCHDSLGRNETMKTAMTHQSIFNRDGYTWNHDSNISTDNKHSQVRISLRTHVHPAISSQAGTRSDETTLFQR